MGDKEVLRLLREKLRRTLAFQGRVKAEAASVALEEEERKRKERE